MTTYTLPATNNLDHIINSWVTNVINGLYGSVTLARNFAGYLGLLILSIPLLLLMPLLTVYLWRFNKLVKRELKLIYDWINEASPAELRYFHLDIEKSTNLLRSLLAKNKIIDKNIFTMGTSSQIYHWINQIFHLEDTLKKAAYPNYDDPLTDEDLNELLTVFEGAEID